MKRPVIGLLLALALARLPLGAAKITEFPLTAGSVPSSIVVGFDGKVWFTELDANKIAAITPAGTIFEYDAPTGGCAPYGLTLSPYDGRLWFACASKTKIGVVGPGPALVDYTIPAYPSGAIAAGPDGNLWFGTTDGYLRTLRVNGTQIDTQYLGNELLGATPGGDGSDWFTIPLSNLLFHARLVLGGFDYGSVTAAGDVGAIAWCAESGTLWFVEKNAGKLGWFKPLDDVSIHDISLPGGAASNPLGIACAPDGSVWYTTVGDNKVGRLRPDRIHFQEFPVPTASSEPNALAVAPDGSIWFTEGDAAKIGHLEFRPQGDVNGDGSVDVSDVFYLINFLFAGGPEPLP